MHVDTNNQFSWDGNFDSTNQHPSFKDRVDLQDRQMKDGDVSLILKNVTINDTGTYECRVVHGRTNHEKRAVLKSNPINIINLSVVVPPAQKNITAKSGENAILPCQDPSNDFTGVNWRRPDEEDDEDEHIFLERDGHIVQYKQHPSFKNRTVLQDREKKDGNVSLILKNVTTNDAGPFECRVYINESYKSISIIYLHVDPPGQTGGHTEDGGKEGGGKEGGSVELNSLVVPAVGLCVFAVLIFFIFGICKGWMDGSLHSVKNVILSHLKRPSASDGKISGNHTSRCTATLCVPLIENYNHSAV